MDRKTQIETSALENGPLRPSSGAYIIAARRLQSQAVSETFALVFGVLGYITGLTAFLAGIKRFFVRRKTANQLASLGPRLLADIGVLPGNLPAHAKQSALEEVPAAPSLIGQIAAWLQLQARHRETARELGRLDRRLLADIGVEPGQIQNVARGLTSPITALAEVAHFVSQPVIQMTQEMIDAVQISQLDWPLPAPANSEAEPRAAA